MNTNWSLVLPTFPIVYGGGDSAMHPSLPSCLCSLTFFFLYCLSVLLVLNMYTCVFSLTSSNTQGNKALFYTSSTSTVKSEPVLMRKNRGPLNIAEYCCFMYIFFIAKTVYVLYVHYILCPTSALGLKKKCPYTKRIRNLVSEILIKRVLPL